MKSTIFAAFALLVSTCAMAQEADPRTCPVQLNLAEADAAGLLRTVHTVGAERDMARSDARKLGQQVEELKKQLAEIKKPDEEAKP